MSDSKEEVIKSYRNQYEDLCRELNMDRETEQLSWKMFVEVLKRSSLEGDPRYWFCCALYAACRLSYTPTVGESNMIVIGNCISLNKLLRCCNMSISEFVTKIKVWHEMANLPSSFLRQIERLERTPGITFHLFCRYNEIYDKLFACPRNEKKNTKYRSVAKCSSGKLYDMCWCLYLCAKNEDPNYNVDIVTSFHLLLCCIDLIYLNVLIEKRVELINMAFEGVPENWGTPSFDPQAINDYCIIGALCNQTGALPNDAKTMKDNYFKHIIEKFIQTKTIYGTEDTFLGLVSNNNFERNLKSLNSSYEQFVLSVGDFDERIILNNPCHRRLNNTDLNGSTFTLHQQDLQLSQPHTPYTRKHILPSKDDVSEPVASATTNVKMLQGIEKLSEPSEFIRQAGNNILNGINEKLSGMLEVFHSNFPNQTEAKKRFQMAQSLFFYLLDKILKFETAMKPNIDLTILLSTETFITTLIACCVEIVMDAYKSQMKFPWILKTFSISAFHFYKIIEIVVRSHDGVLSRPLIKHLNSIEETCLESLAWQTKSPLWEILKSFSLPTWSEVDVDNLSKRNAPQKSALNNDDDSKEYKKQTDGNRRAASLRIFCRKFYKLAWIRLKELCHESKLSGEIHLNKLWTLFEYSITKRAELMQDRHLDQMIMCGIYLYIKVQEIKGTSFIDIMKFYRKQPQANSRTYREVLIEAAETSDSTPLYRDIIYFYNNIYVPKMTPYALNFSEKKQSQQNVPLSPHPTEKIYISHKLSQNHCLYVSRMDKSEHSHSPNHLTYEFSISPGKNLQDFNTKIGGGKRNLPFHDMESNDGPLESKKYKETLEEKTHSAN